MLIGDPPVPDPKYPAKLDDKMFKAMTYYGRWTYKYEIAAQKGAAPSIIIHETEPAAYPWQVVRSSWGKENFELDNPNKNMDAISVRSWITLEVAKKLFTDCGQDFDALKKSAITKEFRPVRFNAKANIDIKQQIRSFKSHNVIGKLEGNDPKLKDEYVIYTAHWDHLGRHPELQGDQIFNGAIDNAYYAEHPLYPLEKTLADINIDGINPWGKTHDLEDLTDRNSSLDELLGQAAARQGRVMKPSSEPEKGGFYRVDSFEFAKAGVPVLHAARSIEIIGKPPEYGKQKRDEFVAKHYHQPSDEVDPTWDLSGAVQDIQLLFEVGYQVANGDKFPEWKPDSEFRVKGSTSCGH